MLFTRKFNLIYIFTFVVKFCFICGVKNTIMLMCKARRCLSVEEKTWYNSKQRTVIDVLQEYLFIKCYKVKCRELETNRQILFISLVLLNRPNDFNYLIYNWLYSPFIVTLNFIQITLQLFHTWFLKWWLHYFICEDSSWIPRIASSLILSNWNSFYLTLILSANTHHKYHEEFLE